MAPTETDYLQYLQTVPEDWSARIHLLSRLAARQAGAEMNQLLGEAPVAIPSESELLQVAALTDDVPACYPSMRQVLAWYIGANPEAGRARLLQARITLRSGDPSTALAQYRAARRRDPSLSDPALEALHAEALARVAASVIPAAPPATAEGAAGGGPGVPPGHADQPRFFVSEVGVTHAQEKTSDTREKISAAAIALVAHLVAGVLLAFLVISQPRSAPPQLVASAEVTAERNELDHARVEKVQPMPVQMASARMEVVSANAFSAVAMPRLDTPEIAVDPLGMGAGFGPSMSFGMGKNGGSVSFFGARSVSKKVIFVVDYSASMGGAKDALMRKELTRSLESLPNGVQYQVIFFAGPAWYAGQTVGASQMHEKFVAKIVKDGPREHVWYEGWDESERHTGNRTSALYHYAEGKDKLPRANYLTASRSTLRKTVEQVNQTDLVFGTDWRWPLMMAMNLRPDTIYFMTDGAFGTGRGVSKKEMIDELLEHNRRNGNARINTICMMILNAREELEQLASGSRGEFTLVLEDGTVARGSQLDRIGQ